MNAQTAEVVICGAGIAGIAAACSSGTPTPTTTVTLTQSPQPGNSTSAGTPSPTSPQAGPAECQTAALRIAVGAGQGAAGTIYYNLDFTNASSATCFLQGYPGVSLVSAGSDAGSQIGADAKGNPPGASAPVPLGPGRAAHAMLGIAHAAQKAVPSPLAFARLIRTNLMHRKRIDRLTGPDPTPPQNSLQMIIQGI